MLQRLVTLLYLSGDAILVKTLASMLQVTEDEVTASIPELEKALLGVGLGLLVAKDGLMIVTHPSQSTLVETFWKKELEGELTPATLQVLTLVAYLGTGTREEVSYIRGVQSAQSIRTLSVRGLITKTGEVLTLTGDALKQLGVTSVNQLPEYETIHKDLREKLEARVE